MIAARKHIFCAFDARHTGRVGERVRTQISLALRLISP